MCHCTVFGHGYHHIHSAHTRCISVHSTVHDTHAACWRWISIPLFRTNVAIYQQECADIGGSGSQLVGSWSWQLVHLGFSHFIDRSTHQEGEIQEYCTSTATGQALFLAKQLYVHHFFHIVCIVDQCTLYEPTHT